MQHQLTKSLITQCVKTALEEDLGRAGDITSQACIDENVKATAMLRSRSDGVLAGLPLTLEAFTQMDPSVQFELFKQDGQPIQKGSNILKIHSNARALLSAERVALNYLQRLCAIATLTAQCVNLVKGTKARITDTRKTTPNMRALEKYAVRCGGGINHRFGLDDAILIKDNHIIIAGGVRQALEKAKAFASHLTKIEIEVDTLDQLQEVLKCAIADVVLLDNMNPDQLKQAVDMAKGQVILEASGGITPANIAQVAQCGVDVISLGFLTHSAQALDIGLDID